MNPIQAHELIDYLAGELSPERYAAVRAALATDPGLAAELGRLQELRAEIAAAPDPLPGPAADRRFAALLAEACQERPSVPKVRHLRPAALLGMAAGVLLLVFAGGWLLGRRDTGQLERQLAATRTLMLDLMADERSTTRMRAATISLEVAVPDPVILENLGYLLRNDQSANVRLAALDALSRFGDAPAARDALLAAMADDPPPAVEAQLLETLVRLREKRVLPYLEELITNDSIPRALRDAAELGTFKLI